MFVSIDFLWDLIHNCNLLLEGSVTEPALLVICKEILHERGTLPVGEVGKMLQELTSISNLSNKLKEKFGGLKKFLERYPDEFVISTDHPFNPHVFIRRMLSAEDLETISRGFVPAQLTAKFKKVCRLWYLHVYIHVDVHVNIRAFMFCCVLSPLSNILGCSLNCFWCCRRPPLLQRSRRGAAQAVVLAQVPLTQ